MPTDAVDTRPAASRGLAALTPTHWAGVGFAVGTVAVLVAIYRRD